MTSQRRVRPTKAAATAALQLLCFVSVCSATSDEVSQYNGARRTVYYQDNYCRLEAFREYVYTARAVDVNGTVSRVNFGECYPRGTTGAITTCNVTDGTSTVETYLDNDCTRLIHSSDEDAQCENLKVAGETCPLGGPASASTDCANMGPYGDINPGTFNLVGSPYEDEACTERTGGDHIVSGDAFGVGNMVCSQSPLVRGTFYSLTECLSDKTIYAKVYGSEDTRCAEDLYMEVLMFPGAISSAPAGGICALGKFADGRQEYYRVNSCTTEAETDKVTIGPTPAPTTLPPSLLRPVEPDPAPVDYRGDGDDEDLSTSVSSDDFSYGIGILSGGGGGDDDDHHDDGDHHDDDDHNDDDDHHDDETGSSSSSRHHKGDDCDGEDDDCEPYKRCGDDDDCDHPDDDCDEDDCDHHRDDCDEDDCDHHDDDCDEDDCDHHRDDCDEDDCDHRDDDCDEDDCDHHHKHCGDDDDCDDDRDAYPGRGKDDDGYDGHKHKKTRLTSDEIFAIVFGCSVAVAIIVTSTLLIIAGESGAKVGPKPAS